MTNFAIICLSVAVGFVALAGIYTVSLGRAAKKPEPEPEPVPAPPVTAKGRPLAHCEACGRTVAVRKGDGMPYQNRHKCELARPAVTRADVDAIGRDFRTAGDDLASVMRDNPPASGSGPERVA